MGTEGQTGRRDGRGLAQLREKIDPLGQGLSNEGSFALLSARVHLTLSEDILVTTTVGKGVATGIWWVRSRDPAKHPVLLLLL